MLKRLKFCAALPEGAFPLRAPYLIFLSFFSGFWRLSAACPYLTPYKPLTLSPRLYILNFQPKHSFLNLDASFRRVLFTQCFFSLKEPYDAANSPAKPLTINPKPFYSLKEPYAAANSPACTPILGMANLLLHLATPANS